MDLDKLIRTYSIYPALWFCGIYSIGIFCGWYFLDQLNYNWLIYFTVGLCLFAIIFHIRFKLLFTLVILPLIFLLGTINTYQAFSKFNPDDLIVSGTKNLQSFRGWISEAHYRKDGNHQYIMTLIAVKRNSQLESASGKILLKQRRLLGCLNNGDILSVKGRPEQPPIPSKPVEFNYLR